MLALVPHAMAANALPAVREVETPRSLRLVAWTLATLAVAAFVALIFAPWTQNIPGSGQVVALDPLDRPASIDAPVSGRIVKWHVLEGTRVNEGDLLVEIRDLDPDRLERFQNQLSDVESQSDSYRNKIKLMEQIVDAVQTARTAKIESAQLKIETAKQYLVAEEAGVRAAEASLDQKQRKLERTIELVAQNIKSPQDQEIDDREVREAVEKVAQAKSKVAAATADLESAKAYLRATSDEERSKVDKASGELLEDRTKLDELSIKRTDLLSKIAQQQTQQVRAPRSGVIQRLLANQGQAIVKAGDPLALLVADTSVRVVELYVEGVNAPLIQPGRPVRLQFEGWPAVQFAGWPSTTWGTFLGTVRLVDPNAEQPGKFRVLVEEPSPMPAEELPWPDYNSLRQGARAKGWVLLEDVGLGFELWRQLNGFPPSLPEKGDAAKDDGEKAAKIKVPK